LLDDVDMNLFYSAQNIARDIHDRQSRRGFFYDKAIKIWKEQIIKSGINLE
jgi:hypothetical protein